MPNRLRRNLEIGAAVFLLSLSASYVMAATPAPAPTAPIVVGEKDPPLCTDEKYLKKIKTQYSDAEMMRENLKIKDLKDIKQLHFGPSPHSVNQYASKTNYGVNSRYCQASATLSDGKADTIYWRMDYMVDGADHSIQYDNCSTKHDTFKDKCIDYIDGK